MGFFHAPPLMWMPMGSLMAAISVWQDRRLVLRPLAKGAGPWKTEPAKITPGVVGAFLAIFAVATVVATALVSVAYWIASSLHPISK